MHYPQAPIIIGQPATVFYSLHLKVLDPSSVGLNYMISSADTADTAT